MTSIAMASQASFKKYAPGASGSSFLRPPRTSFPGVVGGIDRAAFPEAGNGRRPVGLPILPGGDLLQRWFKRSDSDVEEHSMHRRAQLCGQEYGPGGA
jgi:IS5 family transposase